MPAKSSVYRTIECPLLSATAPTNPIQVEIAEKLLLLFLGTATAWDFDQEIRVRHSVGPITPCTMNEDIRRQIFDYLQIEWENRSYYQKVMRCLIPIGSKGGTHFHPHLFFNNPKSNPSSKNSDDPKLAAKILLLEGHAKGYLPLKLSQPVSRNSAGQAVDYCLSSLKSYTEISKLLAKEKREKLNNKNDDGTSLASRAKEYVKRHPDTELLYSYVEANSLFGYAKLKMQNRKIPQEIADQLDVFDVDWKVMQEYFKYQRISSHSETPVFSLTPEYNGRVVYERNHNYHQLNRFDVLPDRYRATVVLDNESHVIEMKKSRKVLGLEVDKGMNVKFYPNNSMGRQKQSVSGPKHLSKIKTIEIKSDLMVQITHQVEQLPCNKFDIKDIEHLRNTLSKSLPCGDEAAKTIGYSQSIQEGMCLMGIDINAYPLLAYSIKRISFVEVSDESTVLPDGRTAYLHDIVSGRIAERTGCYNKMADLIGRIYTMKNTLREDGDVRKASHTLSVIKSRMLEIEKTFTATLTADYYKYLDLFDHYISAVKSLATTGLSDEERKLAQQHTAPRLKKRRENIRKDLTNKIIYEVLRLCYEHQVCLVAMEDFNFIGSDEDRSSKQRRRVQSLLRMKGMADVLTTKLKEINVSAILVDASYTSRTYKDRYWGVRNKDKAILVPYIDGHFAYPVDDDVAAAENIVLRAFRRHSSLFAVYVKIKDDKVVPILKERKKGAMYRKYGKVLKSLPVSVDDCNGSKKMYLFEDEWISERPDDLLRSMLASGAVAA